MTTEEREQRNVIQRKTPQRYAKELYDGQKTWMQIAEKAFRDGENNAIRIIRHKEYKELYKELEVLRKYKKDTEELLNDPDRLSEYIAGL